MQKRTLGTSGISVAPLAFGGNVFGWTADDKTSFALLDAFVDAGFNLVDTADVYSRWIPGHQGGESETIIGKWLKSTGKRDKVVIATKLGIEMGEGKSGLSKRYIAQAVEDSLKRLQTDHIDLYQAHRDDPNTPLDETLEAFADLIKAGKVRAIGASNYDASRLREALDISAEKNIPAYVSLQPGYNLYDRQEFEVELEGLCVERKVGVIPYYSLAAGFLTGKYKSAKDAEGKARGQKVAGYLNDRGFRIVAALTEVAKAHKVTEAAIALAWLIQRPGITAPIASATSLAQFADIAKSTEIRLDKEEIAKLDGASAA